MNKLITAWANKKWSINGWKFQEFLKDTKHEESHPRKNKTWWVIPQNIWIRHVLKPGSYSSNGKGTFRIR